MIDTARAIAQNSKECQEAFAAFTRINKQSVDLRDCAAVERALSAWQKLSRQNARLYFESGLGPSQVTMLIEDVAK